MLPRPSPTLGPCRELPPHLPLPMATCTLKSGETSPPPRSLPQSNEVGSGGSSELTCASASLYPSTCESASPPAPELSEGWEHVTPTPVTPQPTSRSDTRQRLSGYAMDEIRSVLLMDAFDSMNDCFAVKITPEKLP